MGWRGWNMRQEKIMTRSILHFVQIGFIKEHGLINCLSWQQDLLVQMCGIFGGINGQGKKKSVSYLDYAGFDSGR